MPTGSWLSSPSAKGPSSKRRPCKEDRDARTRARHSEQLVCREKVRINNQSPMSFTRGTRLDHYEILSPIGKGGMGEVYRARDTRLGREVAIKTLPTGLTRSGDHLARSVREARAASARNHPNICTIHDLGEHNGQPFMVMELLKGDTLRDLLVRGPLVLDRALEIGQQLADALEAAHRAGIIHRDIKPANIFVSDRDVAKILDFGVASIQHAAFEDAQTQAADLVA